MDEATRLEWLAAAERIAAGIVELAHLEAFVDAEGLRVGFACGGDTALAAAYVEAIGRENIEARQVAPLPGRPADEVVLPCRPGADDELIVQSVLATLKASHALEFGIDLAAEAEAGAACPLPEPPA